MNYPIDIKYNFNAGSERIVLFPWMVEVVLYYPKIVAKLLDIEELQDANS